MSAMDDDLARNVTRALRALGQHGWIASDGGSLLASEDIASTIREQSATIATLRGELAECEPFLKEGERPAERMARDHADSVALLGMLAKERQRAVAAEAALASVRGDAGRLRVPRDATDRMIDEGAHWIERAMASIDSAEAAAENVWAAMIEAAPGDAAIAGEGGNG